MVLPTFTGSIIAAGVEADLYENFTDVSSVYCVNQSSFTEPERDNDADIQRDARVVLFGFFCFS